MSKYIYFKFSINKYNVLCIRIQKLCYINFLWHNTNDWLILYDSIFNEHNSVISSVSTVELFS